MVVDNNAVKKPHMKSNACNAEKGVWLEVMQLLVNWQFVVSAYINTFIIYSRHKMLNKEDF